MTHTLTRSQWVLLHAIDLDVEGLDVTTMAADLAVLRDEGLAVLHGHVWRPTDQGRLMIALRREI